MKRRTAYVHASAAFAFAVILAVTTLPSLSSSAHAEDREAAGLAEAAGFSAPAYEIIESAGTTSALEQSDDTEQSGGPEQPDDPGQSEDVGQTDGVDTGQEAAQEDVGTEGGTIRAAVEEGEARASKAADVRTAMTFDELRTLTTDPAVQYIELGADIVMTADIIIPATKTVLTVDGQGVYTLEQRSQTKFIAYATRDGVFTLQNMSIIGRDYYGVIMCPTGSTGHDIRIINVDYSGPQMIYNRYGTVSFSGSNTVVLQKNGASSNNAEEFGEVHGITIEGDLTIDAYGTTDSFFWMFPKSVTGGTENPFFKVMPGADVRVSTENNRVDRAVFWTEGTNADVDFTVGSGASLLMDVTGYNPLCLNNSHKLRTLTVEQDAQAVFNVGGGVIVSDKITVAERATLRVNYLSRPDGTAASTLPLLRSTKAATGSPVFSFDRPKAVVFAVQPTNRALFEFSAANSMDIITTDFNYWNSYGAAASSDKPTTMWSSEADNGFSIAMSMASGQDKLVSLASGNTDFNTSFSPDKARVVQFGTNPMPLEVATLLIDEPVVSGTTAAEAALYVDYRGIDGDPRSFTGASDRSGVYAVPVEPGSFDNDTVPVVTAVQDFIAVRSTTTVDDKSRWINVRIPTKMLFGSLEEYGDGRIISPRYEMENLSEHPVDIKLAGLDVDRDEGIELLKEGDGTPGASEMQLGLAIQGVTVVEYLHPFVPGDGSAVPLASLAPGTKTTMKLQGTYYGLYIKEGPLKPAYTMILSFEA